MKSLSKTRAYLNIVQTRWDFSDIAFNVHPEDRLIFAAKLKNILEKDWAHLKKQILVLTVSLYHPPRSTQQNKLYRGIVRYICTDPDSEAYGSDPDNLPEGILAWAALSYGYPTIDAAGVRVPERSHKTTTKYMNLLIEVARVVAGENKVDLSDLHLEDSE